MELEKNDADCLKLAIADFTALANHHAKSPDVLLYRGIAESRAESYDQAIADFDAGPEAAAQERGRDERARRRLARPARL